jgi:hypothetical protein
MSYESEPKRKFDDGELTTENEPRGPYSWKYRLGMGEVWANGGMVSAHVSEAEAKEACFNLNQAFSLGRASRDGLRMALVDLLETSCVHKGPGGYEGMLYEDVAGLKKAMAEDEEEGK